MRHRQSGFPVLLALCSLASVGAHATAQSGSTGRCYDEQAELTAADGAPDDQFGAATAVSGDTAVVGVPADDDAGGASGSAHVFVRSGRRWSSQQELVANDAAAGDAFGGAVAIFGDTVIIGAAEDDDAGTASGAAYVFVRNGTTWTRQQKLTANDARANAHFGHSVAVFADTAVIGAPDDDPGGASPVGAAYVFVRNGTTWTEQQKITTIDSFGTCVAVNVDTAVIGAPGDGHAGTDSGSAFVFVRSGSTWSQEQKLTASDAASGDRFGSACSVFGDTTVVGAPADQDAGVDSGSAYVFSRDAATWSQDAKLVSSDAAAGERFGASVGVAGELAVVGCDRDAHAGAAAGAAYVYERLNAAWPEQHKLTASDATTGDRFGSAVSVDDGTLLVGAVAGDGVTADSGSAYAYLAKLQTSRETIRRGTPPNPLAFQKGVTNGPEIGRNWNPVIDHSSFFPTATTDLVAITLGPANIPSPLGTVLCDFSMPTFGVTRAARTPFRIRIPSSCNLAGLSLCSQGGATDGSTLLLTNAIDITIGSRRSLFREISGSFDDLLRAALRPQVSMPIYSVQDFANRAFVRNPDCWASPIDLSGISPWNQAHGPRRAGTLISPRHIAFARHYQLSTAPGNNDVVFVTRNNVTVTRQVVSVRYPGADIAVGLLDSDVPPSIAHYKVLPRDFPTYLLETNRTPMLHLDQEEKALVRDMNATGASTLYVTHKQPGSALRNRFYEVLIGGDSGNPAFLIIDGEAILILTHHFATSGPFYTGYFDAVNNAMTQLGGGYQLTELDLSRWGQ